MVASSFVSPREDHGRIMVVFVPLLTFYVLLRLDDVNSNAMIPSTSATRHRPGDQSATHAQENTQLTDASERLVKPISAAPTSETLTYKKAAIQRPRRHLADCVQKGTRAKTFLVVFMGHSGSSAIMSELEAHSQTFTEQREPVDHYELEHNTTLALAYTRDFFRRGIASGKAAGFKMRPNHINRAPGEWAALAKEFDTRIVWQYRENVLKQAVGEYSYKYLNDSSVLEGLRSTKAVRERCSRGVGCRFEIENLEFFHHTLTDCVHSDMAIMRGVHALAGGSSCVHALPYEDYLYGREEAMRRLHRFLGLGYEETRPERYKATGDNLCEVVGNWKEVCRHFYGCHVWRHMFEDERNGCGCDFASGEVRFCDTAYRGGNSR